MRVTIRLYKTHDLDLIMLTKSSDFKIQKAIYSALCGFVRNNILKIKIPEDFKQGNIPTAQECPNIVQLQIFIDEEKDKDVVEWLLKCKGGYRNALIKNIARSFFEVPLFSLYFLEKEDVKSTFVDSMNINEMQESKIIAFSKQKSSKKEEKKQKQKNKEVKIPEQSSASKSEKDLTKQPVLNNEKEENPDSLDDKLADSKDDFLKEVEESEEYNSFFDDIEALMGTLIS